MSMATGFFQQALRGNLRDFRTVEGPDLIQRVEPFLEWQGRRRALALWPFARRSVDSSGPLVEVGLSTGGRIRAVDFVTEDHLALTRHPKTLAAAQEAIAQVGLRCASSTLGSHHDGAAGRLEAALADFLKMDHVLTFRCGWTATFAAFKAILRPQDHVVVDSGTDPALVDSARCATLRISLHRRGDKDAMRRILARIRAKDTSNAILVVTESLSDATSDAVDLRALREAAREYGAFLLVGVTNDLGCGGEDGTGQLGVQELLGDVDFVVGSLAKVFAVNGGFVAARSPAIREYVRCFSGVDSRSMAMSPIEIAVALSSLSVVRSPEGRLLRERLRSNAIALRAALAACGIGLQGQPSAVVPVVIGTEEIARLTTTICHRLGAVVDLAEYPAASRGQAIIPLRLTVEHQRGHLEQGAQAVGRAVVESLAILARLGTDGHKLVAGV
ncbi:MAG: aminotransferase class I/II-fold pyridoxal phosphate-dependent enzyme [Alphaproteobacteria bacterium]|nr:aminotransferase class I/II-fold pyridoxal phosphate-dependent enzyme [Alphaproteobacteria bacterium]